MTLVIGDWVVQAADTAPIAQGAVRVDGTTIDVVGTADELRRRFPDDDVIDAIVRLRTAPSFRTGWW